ncbi:hypothetical protein [Photobacterium leiognathi]|uniref:hypothetical protein n=1 Tax=Photobacterium leiognathi TaxID=553611 RepID=UPI0029824BA4|nr:hypothetical protein [Photobacterium leiognathi]
MLTDTLSVVILTPDNIKKSHVLLTINSAINVKSEEGNGFYFSPVPLPKQSTSRFFSPISMRLASPDFATNARKYKRDLESIVFELHSFQKRLSDELANDSLHPINKGYVSNEVSNPVNPICPYYKDLMDQSPNLKNIVELNPKQFKSSAFRSTTDDAVFFSSDNFDVEDFVNRSVSQSYKMLYDKNGNTRSTFAIYLSGRCVYSSIPGWEAIKTALPSNEQLLIDLLFNTKHQGNNFI